MAARTAVEQLRSARELISEPRRWCRYVVARDANGAAVAQGSPVAVRWCAAGALYRSVEPLAPDVYDALSCAVRRLYGGLSVSLVNDLEGHAAVLRVFDAALADLEERVQAGG